MPDRNEVTNLAVFCDFENIALGVRDAEYEKFDIRKVLERLLLKGSIVVKKAYCDWERYKAFKAAMHEASFELIEIPHVRQSGKNSADIRMVVDALDLCYTKAHVDTFVIISGDSDFSPLVSKLRENNKNVIGVGVKNSTSDLLIANCDEFIFYDDLVREQRRRTPAKRTPPKPTGKGEKHPARPGDRPAEPVAEATPGKTRPVAPGAVPAEAREMPAEAPAEQAAGRTRAAAKGRPARKSTRRRRTEESAAEAPPSAEGTAQQPPQEGFEPSLEIAPDTLPEAGAGLPEAGPQEAAPGTAPPTSAEAKDQERRQHAIDLVLETIEGLLAERGDNETIWGSMVKQTLKRRQPGFNESYYGFRSFNALLEEAQARGLVALTRDEKSGGFKVRLGERVE